MISLSHFWEGRTKRGEGKARTLLCQQSVFRRRPSPGPAARGRVLLFHDTFNTYNTPAVSRAAVELLEAAGYGVEVLAERKCCGRPMISKGMLDEARAHAAWNVQRLAPRVAGGVAIVGLEPSCLLTLRDEYVDLLRTDEARQVARASFLLEEFLIRERARGLEIAWAPGPRKALLHGHCHQKAIAGTAPTVDALRWAGFEVSEVDSGCCGMAGSFGFEREHYDLSMRIGAQRLFPSIQGQPEAAVAATGVSCRQQIAHGTGRAAVHPVVLLRNMVRAGPS